MINTFMLRSYIDSRLLSGKSLKNVFSCQGIACRKMKDRIGPFEQLSDAKSVWSQRFCQPVTQKMAQDIAAMLCQDCSF